MSIEIDVVLDKKSLNRFLIYHNYSRFSGVIGVVISLAALVGLFWKWGAWTVQQRVILVLLSLLFTVFQPLMLMWKGRKQLMMEEFQIPFHYVFDEDGVTISQNEQSQKVAWKEIRKIKYGKDAIYVYTSTISAFVVPRSQCDGKFDELVALMKENKKR